MWKRRASLIAACLLCSGMALGMSGAVQAGVGTPPVPLQATPRLQLETESHVHHQALLVDRDFGEPWRDIVVDAWVPREGEPRLDEVRMWWLETNDDDIRKPFSEKTKKRVEVRYRKRNDRHWVIDWGAGSKEFSFDVKVSKKGRVSVYADVVAVSGETLDNCRILSAKMYAKKIFGKAVGIDRLDVRCVDSSGTKWDAVLEG